MTTLKIADLRFCESLIETPLDINGGFTLGVYRSRRSAGKLRDGVSGKSVSKTISSDAPTAPVMESVIAEPAIFSTGVVSRPNGTSNESFGSLGTSGSFSIDTSI
jgi:hypothetical protein